MSEPTNAARELAATGTPEPWARFEEHGRDYTDEAWSVVGVITGTRYVALTHPTGSDHEDHEADAEKIASAVNALGPLGDLREHIQRAPSIADSLRDWHLWYARLVELSDAVEAALRGEQP